MIEQIRQLFAKLANHDDEIRRLRGDINKLTNGSVLLPNVVPGTSSIPNPVSGAMIYGTTTPLWGRLPPPDPGDDYSLRFLDGADAPSWELGGGGGGVTGLFYIPFGSGEEVFSP